MENTSIMNEEIKFIYNEPALLVENEGARWLVVGDLHIGSERRLLEKGVRIYDAWGQMAKSLLSLYSSFSATGLILLGDLKDSILYPESWELESIRRFISELSNLNLKIIKGNHDAHLGELIGIKAEDEFLLGDFAFLHGNALPSQEAMQKKFIITAHNHIAVRIIDENGGVYSEKAWLISKVSKSKCRKFYPGANASQLIIIPAFNPLILGMPVNEPRKDKDNINPLFRNGIFNYKNSQVYSISGNYIGTVKTLSKKVSSRG